MKKIDKKDLIVIQKIGEIIVGGIDKDECAKLRPADLLKIAGELKKVCSFFEKQIEKSTETQEG